MDPSGYVELSLHWRPVIRMPSMLVLVCCGRPKGDLLGGGMPGASLCTKEKCIVSLGCPRDSNKDRAAGKIAPLLKTPSLWLDSSRATPSAPVLGINVLQAS